MINRYRLLFLTSLLCAAFQLGLSAAERELTWSGMTWLVKAGKERGPGPNNWSDDQTSVWVDKDQRLHLKIRKIKDLWSCAEIKSKQITAYGRYHIELDSPVDRLDQQVVFGAFAYVDDSREVDLEISSWGKAGIPKRQFVVQPYHKAGHLDRGALLGPGPGISYQFDWLSTGISANAKLGSKTHQWTFSPKQKTKIPDASKAHFHLNLWLFRGKAPVNGKEQEVIIKSVKFIPEEKLKTVKEAFDE